LWPWSIPSPLSSATPRRIHGRSTWWTADNLRHDEELRNWAHHGRTRLALSVGHGHTTWQLVRWSISVRAAQDEGAYKQSWCVCHSIYFFSREDAPTIISCLCYKSWCNTL
jgi:hypothetical protein